MTTPIPDPSLPWAVLRPLTVGTFQLLTVQARSSGSDPTRMALPVGVNTVMVTWTGSGQLNIQLRNASNAIYRTVNIAASSAARQVSFPVPVPAAGHTILLEASAVTADDVAKAVAGIQIIPSAL